MNTSQSNLWKETSPQQLAEVLAAIRDTATMQTFLRDVMTEKEITEVSARLEAAKMLQQGKRYTEIIAVTKLSSRTIARINDWLQQNTGGYQTALSLITDHHVHIPPARAR